jgi:5S rRNA maturation endonuclease (ribonuclease M5)
MSLNIARLNNVHPRGNETIAECPACAETGGDTSGDHLFIDASGKFGCVNNPGAAGVEHRKRIFALVGEKDAATNSAPKTQKRIVETYDYTDAAGKLLFQVVRFDPKDFRQRRPDDNGGWIWNMDGVKRVLYRLPGVIEAVKAGQVVYLPEGEKDCEALVKLGLCSTCNPGGAGKWVPQYTATLTGAKIIIIADKDKPGREHAELVARNLEGKAMSINVIELPDRSDRKVKDAADWIQAGGTAGEFQEVVRNAPAREPPAAEPAAGPAASIETKDKPAVLLPHGAQSISDTGAHLGELLAKTGRFFIRGGAVAKLTHDPDGLPVLDDVKPVTLASDFEAVAVLYKTDDGKPKPATCSETTARLISASTAFRNAMAPITVLTRCPVLIERAGEIMQICGYDRQSGIFAAGQPAVAISIAEARRLLCEILSDFKFATLADRARALAAIITPSLIFGGLLRGRAPVDLGEANASQGGKGFRNKLTAALYAQSVQTITQQKGGVGSIEETFNAKLIRGANFISIDNVRGKIDSQSFESFLTEDTYSARMPYREPIEIDPRRIVVMLTSNKADITTDFANRCSCVRILKQDSGYVFTPYPEGDILDHVRANQPRFLGAVFSIIYAWDAAGRPKTNETRHDFRPWAQTLDWITQNLLDAGPLLDGHRETQARMTNPVLNWLRDVALEIIRAKQANAWLRASDLIDLLSETTIETPGMPEHGDLTDPETRKAAQQATGRKLGLCFRAGDILTLDGMTIERREEYDQENRYTVREYRFTAAAMEPEPVAAQPAAVPDTPHERTPEQAEIGLCGYAAATRAASHAAKEMPIAANAADTCLQGDHLNTLMEKEGINICSIGTISRIAAKSATEGEINNDFDLSAKANYPDTEEGEI